MTFERKLIAPTGHLPDATLDLTMERTGELLRRGTVLVGARDPGIELRVCGAVGEPPVSG